MSTVLLTDGHTAILTDGFFSRPGPIRLATARIEPNRRRIQAALDRAGITALDAVFVAHSHFDHAMDSATVASLTGAQLFGSPTTHHIAISDGLAETRIRILDTGKPIALGKFTITSLPATHSPGDIAPGTINTPLPERRTMRSYKTGECYSFHIRHGSRTLLIHASANFITDALNGQHADTVYLGVGALSKQSDTFKETYWRETVTNTGARRVVPIHWDNFTRSLNRPLRPLPRPFDDIPTTLKWLQHRAHAEHITLQLPRFGQPADPWAQHLPRTK